MTTLEKIQEDLNNEQYEFMGDDDYCDGVRFGLMLAHQIIDKYATEDSRVKNELNVELNELKPCEDAVSRQAVLKELKGCLTGGETEYKYVKIHIDSIPSVRPQEPKTGRWMWQLDSTSRSFPHEKILRCSQCNDWQTYGETRFCPNCGAEMGVSE